MLPKRLSDTLACRCSLLDSFDVEEFLKGLANKGVVGHTLWRPHLFGQEAREVQDGGNGAQLFKVGIKSPYIVPSFLLDSIVPLPGCLVLLL